MRMARRSMVAGLFAAAVLLQGCATTAGENAPAQSVPAPLKVYGATMTTEIAPLMLAVQALHPDGPGVQLGGVASLVNEEVRADVAANAETQLLRHSVNRPDLRIIMTIVEGKYRIVARKSAGIVTLADLKGKRIATLRATSADFFLARMLEQAGLTEADVTVVNFMPLEDVDEAIAKHEIDAVAIWEPFSENALRALGGDAIEFSGKGIYTEHYNLNTTAAALADPVKRKQIVTLMQEIIRQTGEMNRDPSAAHALVAKSGKYPVEEVARSWPHHDYYAGIADDMLEVLVVEEKWLAGQEKRQPRTREQLAQLIDWSAYEEALAGLNR